MASFKLEYSAVKDSDGFAGEAIFAVMKVAAEGRCDAVTCEFPLSMSSGLIGELRIDIGATKYRLYFAQPKDDMTALVALKLGSKTHDDDEAWKTQQNQHINEAMARYYSEFQPPPG